MTEDRPFRAIDAIVVIATVFVLQVLMGLAIPPNLPSHVQGILAGVGTVAGLAAGIWMRRKSLRSVLALGRFTPALAFWTVFGTAGLCLVILSFQQSILDLFPRAKPELDKLDLEIRTYPASVLLLMIVVMAPLIEEALFRGVVLRGLRSSWGVVAGLLLSSALFGLIHGIAPRILITFFVGLWLGSLFLKSGGLAIPILGHFFYNGLVLVLGFSGLLYPPIPFALPGALAVLLASWRLFGSRTRSVQGSAAPGPS